MINVPVNKHIDPNISPISYAVSAAEKELAGNGRVLVRASGTEPVLRVMVEGKDVEQVNNLAQQLAEVVKKAA